MRNDPLSSRILPVLTIVVVIIAVWYAAAIWMNAPFQRDLDRRGDVTSTTMEFIGKTLSQPKPVVPAPHQVAQNVFENTFLRNVTSNRSLVYHSWVTLSSTLAGFASGTLLGILIAVGIVHVKALDRSLMPWIIASQTVPILAIAPMVVVWINPKLPESLAGWGAVAVIAAYLTFFPVTINTLRGLQSADPRAVELMRSYAASRSKILWKLRIPASFPFLFTALKIAAPAAVVGAIIGELPSSIQDGLAGAILNFNQYYITSPESLWATNIIAALLGILFFVVVALAERLLVRRAPENVA
jgi:NitT/TauT family transport system permease protein